MEYSIGNIYVAFSWSDYFTSFLHKINVHIPDYLTCSYHEAKITFLNYSSQTASEQLEFLKNQANAELLNAWNNSPVVGSLRIILDLPALIINVLITTLVYIGIKESRNFSNAMVILKLVVVALVIVVGAYYIDPANWLPVNEAGVKSFMPNGFSGVMAAVSGVFFAYIGFDAVSVLAEESKNPQRDLPKGMTYSLVICTVVYILLALVLTGVVPYKQFQNVGDPLAKIFEVKNVGWMQLLVSVCAVIAMTSVLLVFQMGQPRIWMSMSRDGLLPPVFQRIHKKFKTPSFATILTGIVVGLPILFTDKTFVLDFTSIATLFAFVLVCGGVLLIPRKEKVAGRFNMPFINAQYIFPLLILASLVILMIFVPGYFSDMFNFDFSADSDFAANKVSFMDLALPKISLIIFWLSAIVLSIMAFVKKYSLIPLMGVTTCLYLLTGMTKSNWAWFLGWLALGLVIYFLYGYRKSRLANAG
jgi:amino acid transporter